MLADIVPTIESTFAKIILPFGPVPRTPSRAMPFSLPQLFEQVDWQTRDRPGDDEGTEAGGGFAGAGGGASGEALAGGFFDRRRGGCRQVACVFNSKRFERAGVNLVFHRDADGRSHFDFA